MDYKEMACKLWQLLDDISTLDDACKENDASFRKQAMKCAEKRNSFLHSDDGYRLLNSLTGEEVQEGLTRQQKLEMLAEKGKRPLKKQESLPPNFTCVIEDNFFELF